VKAASLSSQFGSTIDGTSAVLHIFMVRNPFDRLLSLFNYMHRHVGKEAWKEFTTEDQYDCVRADDFSGWLNLIRTEQKIPLGAQHAYIDNDVDKAISLITGVSPRVIVLVNECFEASLRILENKLALRSGAVDSFLNSSIARSNVSTRKNSAALADLRERSKQYLSNEYKFYNVAVQQFKRQLSSLNASLLQGCD